MATTSVKPGVEAPREIRQSVMDGLVRNLNKVVTVTRAEMSESAPVTTTGVLRYVDSFRNILVECGSALLVESETSHFNRIPFIRENGAIISIAVSGNGKVAFLYKNPVFESAGQKSGSEHIRETLGLGVDTLRRLSFGPEIAHILEQDDAIAALARR